MLIREKIRHDYTGDMAEAMRIEWDFAHKQIFGIEVNERIARIAMMNMIIHEDAHSNIECNNALLDFQEFNVQKRILPNKFTVVLTNPPLGKSFRETSEILLKKYELGNRKSQVLSVLFIERCFELLDYGGLLGIVLDEGILSNPSLQYVRDFIIKKARIRAIISLPKFAFQVVGAGAKTSILILEKKKIEIKDYPIFVAHINHVGYDAVGRQDKNELPYVLKEYEKYRRNPEDYKGFRIEETKIVRSTKGYRSEILESWAIKLSRSKLDGRLDARHYNPRFEDLLKILSRSPYERKALEEISQNGRIYYPPRLRRNYTDKDKGVPFLSIRNIEDHELNSRDIKYLSKKTKNLESYRVKEGWILVTRSGSVGNAVLVPKKMDGYLASEHFIRVIPREEYNPSYILIFLRTSMGKAQTEKEIYGAVVDEISVDSTKAIKVPIPPKQLQDELVQLVEKARKRCAELRNQGDQIVDKAEKEFAELLIHPKHG